ncbi:MAG: PepSY domain-containing protein [Rhodospirillaceae bacterium]|nr:PepSY domain-containing protein [Rhodospirillales bacterium]
MKTVFYLALAVLLALSTTAHAGDHDRARRAVQSGQVLPLKTILDKAMAEFPGDLIEAELEDEHGALVYEIKLISPEGNVIKLLYDAKDGHLLSAKGRGVEKRP